VLGAAIAKGGATVIRLGLRDDEATRELWPHSFALELEVAVGVALRVSLIARNTGSAPFTCTGALHSYLAVGDVTLIAIHGLEGCAYVDKVNGGAEKVQRGLVTIVGETDRVYHDTVATCTIDDPVLGRRIAVAKRGSRSTIIWNPWQEKARRLADFDDDAYPSMVCVEAGYPRTGVALNDAVTIPPGGEHRLETTIGVERTVQP